MIRPALDPEAVRRVVAAALEEDLDGSGDLTSRALVDETLRARAAIVARERLVLAGLAVAEAVFRMRDPSVVSERGADDGDEVTAGSTVLTVIGSARALLEGERTALNFLQRMCGVAGASRAACREVAGSGTVVLDTRKTAPGLRLLDKYAVACGGATNHRMGLYDAIMIKDTHLAVAGAIEPAVRRVLALGHPPETITVEVTTADELLEAIEAGAGRVLLDNMDLETLALCVRLGKDRIVLEASGGLHPGRLREVADTGVDCLSLGYLTHSVLAADLAIDLEPLP